MSKSQRRYLADKLGDLANLAMAALIFGQLATGRRLDFELTKLGVGIGIMLYLWGVILVKSVRLRKAE